MVRTQVQLTESQFAALKRAARERGVSIAALIREAVDLAVAQPSESRRARALRVAGISSSGLSDVAVDHDRYLEDAYLE